MTRLISRQRLKYQRRHPFADPQEESADIVDGRRKQSKNCRSPEHHGKTVYTYKRNIRMKLHMDTRFSPFLSLQEEA
jgi:hypothetical protein